MRKFFFFQFVILLCIFFDFSNLLAENTRSNLFKGSKTEDYVQVNIFGNVKNPYGRGIYDVKITVLLNNQPFPLKVKKEKKGGHSAFFVKTDLYGDFQVEFNVPKKLLQDNQVIKLEFFKPNYKKNSIELSLKDFAFKNNTYYKKVDIVLPRIKTAGFWIAAIVFVLTYLIIAFELVHRTLVAMLGSAILLLVSYTLGTWNPEYHIISYETAIHSIDMNVIFLLMGMMIIIGVLKNTGIFQWCTYQCFKLARGKIFLLSVILMIFTGATSAFLDNVTTMLLLTPVTIEIARTLRINPFSLLIPEILASNVGGTATLVGDPPNIIIGSYTGFTFLQFVKNLAPVVIPSLFLLFFYTWLVYRKEYRKVKIDDIDGFIRELREKYRITDATLLTVGLIVLSIVVVMFILHGLLEMEVFIPAIFGASVLLVYGFVTKRINLIKLIEKDIEWLTLLFFIFLFILVGCVEQAGLLDLIADWVFKLSQGDLIIAICLILWVSAILSGIVDNIPFTVTMLPVTAYLTKVIPGAESGILWWALALGACFGGNSTLIGASANLVTVGIAESVGYRITFFEFMKKATIYTIISLIAANIWLVFFLK